MHKSAITNTTHLLHRSYSIHLLDLRTNTLDLDADVGALFDDLLSVVSPLGRCGVCIVCDVRGDHLGGFSEQALWARAGKSLHYVPQRPVANRSRRRILYEGLK